MREFVHLGFCARRFASLVGVASCASCAQSGFALQAALALNTAYWGAAVAARVRNRVLCAVALLRSRAPRMHPSHSLCNSSVNDARIELAACKDTSKHYSAIASSPAGRVGPGERRVRGTPRRN